MKTLLVVGLLSLTAAVPGAQAVDLSGDYLLNLAGCRLTFTESVTFLDVQGTCGPGLVVSGGGTVDPATGAFTFSASVDGGTCNYDVAGVGDGRVFSAMLKLTGGSGGGACPTGTVFGSKCGNGLLDPGEECDDANASDGDCCSASCLPAPVDATCAIGGNVCMGLCDGAGTCNPVPNTAACNDGNPCTTADGCSGGICVGTPVATGTPCGSDYNSCTDDVCDAGACTHPANTAACDDFNGCTTGDVCAGGACHGTPVPGGTACAADYNVCTDDVCDGTGGCTHVPHAGACDDGRECTTADACVNGSCQGAPLAAGTACNGDNNACTDDVCDGAGGCTHQPNTDPCDDGNACSGPDVCTAGACVPAGVEPVCQGTIDLTGTWLLSPPVPISNGYTLESVTFTQTGAVLSLTAVSLTSFFGQLPAFTYPGPGAINPATGQFSIGSLAVIFDRYFAFDMELYGTAFASGFRATLNGYDVTSCVSGSCCGNGIVEPWEACDDASCCDTSCSAAKSFGTWCSGDPCDGAICDGAGRCVPAEGLGARCEVPSLPRGAKLSVRQSGDPYGRNQIHFRWTGGLDAAAGFGDPTDGSTSYAMCIYGEDGLKLQTAVPGRLFWSKSATVLRFRDPLGSNGGLRRISLASASHGSVKIRVDGAGRNVLPALPYASKVWAAFRASNGSCWSATFTQPKSSTDTVFSGSSD